MKSRLILTAVLAASSLLSACTKNTDDNKGSAGLDNTGPDYSGWLLSNVKYPIVANLPYTRDPLALEYDSLQRIIQTTSPGVFNVYAYEADKIVQEQYFNAIGLSNMTARMVYYYDNNKNISHHTTAWYNRPASIDDYTRMDVTEYEYNADGYLTGLKSYMYGNILFTESKLTWQNGNLTRQETTQYDVSTSPTTVAGTNTVDYTYDNKPLYPEARFLYEMTDYRINKLNKNNVNSIAFKRYGANNLHDDFKTIEYTYTETGKRLGQAAIKAITESGKNVTGNISFEYRRN